MSIVVENCCESLCDGCPWADEQKEVAATKKKKLSEEESMKSKET